MLQKAPKWVTGPRFLGDIPAGTEFGKVIGSWIVVAVEIIRMLTLCIFVCFHRWTRKRWRGWWSSTRTLFSAQWCRTAREPWRELIKWAGAPTHQTLRSYRWSAHTYTTHNHIATRREGAPLCVQTTNAQYLQLRHVCISFTVQTFMSAHSYTPVWGFRSQNVATEAIFHLNNPTKIGLLVFYTKWFLVPVLYHSYTLFSSSVPSHISILHTFIWPEHGLNFVFAAKTSHNKYYLTAVLRQNIKPHTF